MKSLSLKILKIKFVLFLPLAVYAGDIFDGGEMLELGQIVSEIQNDQERESAEATKEKERLRSAISKLREQQSNLSRNNPFARELQVKTIEQIIYSMVFNALRLEGEGFEAREGVSEENQLRQPCDSFSCGRNVDILEVAEKALDFAANLRRKSDDILLTGSSLSQTFGNTPMYRGILAVHWEKLFSYLEGRSIDPILQGTMFHEFLGITGYDDGLIETAEGKESKYLVSGPFTGALASERMHSESLGMSMVVACNSRKIPPSMGNSFASHEKQESAGNRAQMKRYFLFLESLTRTAVLHSNFSNSHSAMHLNLESSLALLAILTSPRGCGEEVDTGDEERLLEFEEMLLSAEEVFMHSPGREDYLRILENFQEGREKRKKINQRAKSLYESSNSDWKSDLLGRSWLQ